MCPYKEEITSIEKVLFDIKIIIGGIDQHHDFYGAREEVKDRLRKRLESALRETKDNRFILAPGCALPLDANREIFTVMHEVVDEFGLIQ